MVDRTELFATFHAASRYLERAGIRHWIDFGTLLGAIREGGYIATDQDLDFDFYRSDLPRILGFQELFRRSLKLELIFEPAANTVRLLPHHPTLDLRSDFSAHRSCIDADIPYVDLYPCWDDGKWIRHALPEYDFRSIYCRRLKCIQFETWPLPCPQNQLSLIRHRYGKEWNVPLGRKEFDDQALRIIEPFPENLGCLLVVTDSSTSDVIENEVLDLRMDFDKVCIQFWNDSKSIKPFESNQFRLPSVELIPHPAGPVSLDWLNQCHCHFVKVLGETAGRVSQDVKLADVLLE